jgi:hypothetical protein
MVCIPSFCFRQTGREILQLQQAIGGGAMKEEALLNEAAATLLGIKPHRPSAGPRRETRMGSIQGQRLNRLCRAGKISFGPPVSS